MIIDLNKYLFIGTEDALEPFFEYAQERGFVEFISPNGKRPSEFPSHLQEIVRSLKILKRQPEIKQWEGGGKFDFAHQIAHKVVAASGEISKLQEERRLIESEIARVQAFGDFSMQDINWIEEKSGYKFHFFCMKTDKSRINDLGENVFYIATVFDLDYFIALSKEEPDIPNRIEMRIDHPVSELNRMLEQTVNKIEENIHALRDLAKYTQFLQDTCLSEVDTHTLKFAKKEVYKPLDEKLFAVEGWVPQDSLDELEELVKKRAVHMERVEIEQQDVKPTCMKNSGVSEMGQDLALIYDTPAPTDKDPSRWIFFAFAFFFAFIIADGGYGLLFLALAIFLKYKFPKMKAAGKRVTKLVGVLGLTCFVWGLLTASFFGLQPKPDRELNDLSITSYLARKKAEYHIHQKDDVHEHWLVQYPNLTEESSGKQFLKKGKSVRDGKTVFLVYDEFLQNILLEFSLIIGVIHITLSFLRYLRRNFSGIGWIAFMFGGYLYFPSLLNATSIINFMGWIPKERAYESGEQLLYAGLVAAPVIAVIQHGLKGLKEITLVIEIFADVLSYLRLYALALAATLMAETFNALGQDIGLAFGIIVILLGHSINITLGVMSGVIHGLRLNFLEWYHYCFDGGGRLFAPLKKLLNEDK